jgi:hypothetical protein
VAPKLEELKPMVSMSAAIKAVHFIETRLLYGVTSYPTILESQLAVKVRQTLGPLTQALLEATWRLWRRGVCGEAGDRGRRLGGRLRLSEPVESSMDSNDPLR